VPNKLSLWRDTSGYDGVGLRVNSLSPPKPLIRQKQVIGALEGQVRIELHSNRSGRPLGDLVQGAQK